MKRTLQGNRALCEGAIAGGLDAYYAYPITPQNEISAYFSQVLPGLCLLYTSPSPRDS